MNTTKAQQQARDLLLSDQDIYDHLLFMITTRQKPLIIKATLNSMIAANEQIILRRMQMYTDRGKLFDQQPAVPKLTFLRS